MATVEFLQKRVAGKEKEIATLEKKLERIKKAEASNWENNPYWYNERDLRCTLRDIEVAKHALAEYQLKLEAEVEKNNSRNVQVILDFLADWKKRVYDFYHTGLVEYFNDRNKLKQMTSDLHAMKGKDVQEIDYFSMKELEEQVAAATKDFKEAKEGVFEAIPKDSPSYRKWYNEKKKVATGRYEYLKEFFGYSTLDDALDALTKSLDMEANAKYDDIVERTNSIVGQIVDASFLRIGPKGDLNGYVIGTRGKASVQTIGAGGYNIQCYHYRTLIREMK